MSYIALNFLKWTLLLISLYVGPPSSQMNWLKTSSDIVWMMIDVSPVDMQGDAHLIKTKGGKQILIDTGARVVAQTHLLPALRAAGVTYLDEVFITHPHFDHYGGLIDLINSEIDIKLIRMGPVTERLCLQESFGCDVLALKEIKEGAKNKNILLLDYTNWNQEKLGPHSKLKKWVQFNEDNHPNPSTDINDLSLIFELEYGPVSVLFTGDLNQYLSRWMIKRSDLVKHVDILKVPHHGADSLAVKAFFKRVSPNVALIPAGRKLWESSRCDNARSVLNELKVKNYVNGIEGNIYVHFYRDRYRVSVERFRFLSR